MKFVHSLVAIAALTGLTSILAPSTAEASCRSALDIPGLLERLLLLPNSWAIESPR